MNRVKRSLAIAAAGLIMAGGAISFNVGQSTRTHPNVQHWPAITHPVIQAEDDAVKCWVNPGFPTVALECGPMWNAPKGARFL